MNNIISILKKIKNFFRKRTNYLKKFFFILSLIFIIKESFVEFNEVKTIIELDYEKFLIILIVSVINLNIKNIRIYYLLKKITKYSNNFINWSKLFFQTVIMNLLLTGTGHFFRAIQLKKDNLKYSEFVSLNYVIYIISHLINILVFVSLFYLISQQSVSILLIVIILFTLYLLTSETFYKFFLNFFKKRVNFLKSYRKIFFSIIMNCKKFFSFKKNLIIFSLITLIMFFLDGVIIYLILSSILSDESVFNNLLFFFIIFYLNKFAYIQNIIGLNELIVGLIAETLGFLFLQGALIQLVFRLNIYLGCIINNLLYFILKLKMKNKY